MSFVQVVIIQWVSQYRPMFVTAAAHDVDISALACLDFIHWRYTQSGPRKNLVGRGGIDVIAPKSAFALFIL